jgi:hypothetical protein
LVVIAEPRKGCDLDPVGVPGVSAWDSRIVVEASIIDVQREPGMGSKDDYRDKAHECMQAADRTYSGP